MCQHEGLLFCEEGTVQMKCALNLAHFVIEALTSRSSISLTKYFTCVSILLHSEIAIPLLMETLLTTSRLRRMCVRKTILLPWLRSDSGELCTIRTEEWTFGSLALHVL